MTERAAACGGEPCGPDERSGLRIDIVSDVVCPWCYIGRRKLAIAAERWAAEGGGELEVRWHPFELNPDLPRAGIPRSEHVARKFGARGDAIYDRVAAAGASVGLALAFDRIMRQPNTRAAHALIAAAPAGVQDALVDALFRAYFVDGRDLTDDAVLLEIAVSAGLAASTANAALADEALAAQIESAERRAAALGVNGVPFLIFGGRVAVSGAQDPEVMLEAMRKAVDEQNRAGGERQQ